MSGYSALDNVMLPRLLWDKNDPGVRDDASRLLGELDVKEDRMAEQRSGGERQRTALARVLINSPKLILADESPGHSIPSYEMKPWICFSTRCGNVNAP